MQNSKQDKKKSFQDIQKHFKNPPTIKKKTVKWYFFKAERRHIYFFLPPLRLNVYFNKKSPKILGKKKTDLKVSWAPSPFLTPCSGWNLGLLSLRALPGSAPVALPEPAVQIPLPPTPPTSPLQSHFLLWAKINISRAELEVEQSRAELKFMFCQELFIGRII